MRRKEGEEKKKEKKKKKRGGEQKRNPINYGNRVFQGRSRISNYAQALVILLTTYITCMTANLSLYLSDRS
jgi:hypothetical protein